MRSTIKSFIEHQCQRQMLWDSQWTWLKAMDLLLLSFSSGTFYKYLVAATNFSFSKIILKVRISHNVLSYCSFHHLKYFFYQPNPHFKVHDVLNRSQRRSKRSNNSSSRHLTFHHHSRNIDFKVQLLQKIPIPHVDHTRRRWFILSWCRPYSLRTHLTIFETKHISHFLRRFKGSWWGDVRCTSTRGRLLRFEIVDGMAEREEVSSGSSNQVYRSWNSQWRIWKNPRWCKIWVLSEVVDGESVFVSQGTK